MLLALDLNFAQSWLSSLYKFYAEVQVIKYKML